MCDIGCSFIQWSSSSVNYDNEDDDDLDDGELCAILAAAHLYSGAPPWGGVLCDGDPPPIMQSCFAGDEIICDDYGGSDDDVSVNNYDEYGDL